MAVDRNVAAELLARKSDIHMPSAEGAAGYPPDLLDLSVEELRALLSNGTGNGHRSVNGAREHRRRESTGDESEGSEG